MNYEFKNQIGGLNKGFVKFLFFAVIAAGIILCSLWSAGKL